MEEINTNTSKLTFDINSKTFINDVESAIPVLKDIKLGLPKKKAYQYIVLMYDIGSPMHRNVSDYYQKKYKCAEMVGFPKKDGRFDERVTAALTGTNKQFNKAIAAYLDHLASPEYTQLVALKIIMSEEMKKILSGKIDDKSDQILDRVTNRMRDLTREVYSSGEYDEVADARRALYEQAEKTAFTLRPEEIAELLSKGDELPDDFNPYEDGYKPDKMKFLADNVEDGDRIMREKYPDESY